MDLTPPEIVAELDRYIIGQKQAKRAVAIALRNRYRRSQLPLELREEILPKNILMIGPTGVGKTEIAKRLARLAQAPFVKVEATKFTEVGYVGRDVDSIIRELVDVSVRLIKSKKMEEVKDLAEKQVEKRLLDLLVLGTSRKGVSDPLKIFWGLGQGQEESQEERGPEIIAKQHEMRELLQNGKIEDQLVELEVEKQHSPFWEMMPGLGGEDLGIGFQEMLGELIPKRTQKKKVSVAQARRLLLQEEATKLIDMEAILAEAATSVEEAGIVFIDEIDKIAGGEGGSGPGVSREGVQRDILPIIEGSTVLTKAGPVRTDHILFIAAGAFNLNKPADLIPELQGRFPIRVNLASLTAKDFAKILIEPQNSLIKQYIALLKTENVDLSFTEDGILTLAEIAEKVNRTTENIGARRLHTVLERLLEEISYKGSSLTSVLIVDGNYVQSKLDLISQDCDLSRYIL